MPLPIITLLLLKEDSTLRRFSQMPHTTYRSATGLRSICKSVHLFANIHHNWIISNRFELIEGETWSDSNRTLIIRKSDAIWRCRTMSGNFRQWIPDAPPQSMQKVLLFFFGFKVFWFIVYSDQKFDRQTLFAPGAIKCRLTIRLLNWFQIKFIRPIIERWSESDRTSIEHW